MATVACQREDPEQKPGKLSEPAGQLPAAEGTLMTPVEKAKQVEPTLERAADRTATAVKKATE